MLAINFTFLKLFAILTVSFYSANMKHKRLDSPSSRPFHDIRQELPVTLAWFFLTSLERISVLLYVSVTIDRGSDS